MKYKVEQWVQRSQLARAKLQPCTKGQNDRLWAAWLKGNPVGTGGKTPEKVLHVAYMIDEKIAVAYTVVDVDYIKYNKTANGRSAYSSYVREHRELLFERVKRRPEVWVHRRRSYLPAREALQRLELYLQMGR